MRAAGVPSFQAMAMNREAAALEATGRRILHLEVGQPSTPLPSLAREAVQARLHEPLGYTSASGLQPLRKRLADRDLELELDDAARSLLGEAGFDPVYGARPLKRAIQQQLENPLAQSILRGDFGPGDRILVTARDGALAFEKQGAATGRATV